jgi:hypothetical protein
MKFYQRFAYYLIGLIIGSFFVAAVLSGKDSRCNYFPNARVLNDLRNKPFNYSIEASRKLSEDWIDTIDIKNTLTYGDVDFEKSNEPYRKGKIYIIEGKTSKNEDITITMVNYPERVLLEKIEKK